MWSGTICKNDEHKWDNCSPSKVLTTRTQKIIIQTDKTQKLLLNFPIKVKVRVMTQGVFIPALFSPSESDSGLFSSSLEPDTSLLLKKLQYSLFMVRMWLGIDPNQLSAASGNHWCIVAMTLNIYFGLY